MSSVRRDLTLISTLAILVAVGYVGGALVRSGGHPILPLDDAFIFLQCAERTSQLHLFEYFPGEGFMTGVSSPLWTLLLIPGFWIGLKGAQMVLWIWLLSGALWLGSVLLVHRIGTLAAGRGTGLLAAMLFLVHGHVAWAYWNGMETGLFAFLMLLAVYGVQRWVAAREARSDPGPWIKIAWLATAALSVTRPEGLGLAIAAAAIVALRAKRGLTGGAQVLGWLATALPGVLYLAVVRLATGFWTTNGLVAKGIMSDPYLSLGEKLRAIGQNWFDLWGGYHMGEGDIVWFFRSDAVMWVGPMILLLAMIGAGPGLMGLAQRGRGEGIGLAAIWYILGTGAACTSAVAFSHLARYFVVYLPLLLILAALGVHELAALWRSRGPHVQTMLGIIPVLLTAPSLLWWGEVYAENCQDIYEQHRRMSWWLQEEVPAGTRVGLTDVGMLTYQAPNQRACDLVGLTSTSLAPDLPRQALVMRNGLGSIWETLERWEDRPELIITYPNLWTPSHQPELWLGEPIHSASLAGDSITSGQQLQAYRPDWSGVGSGDLPGPDAFAIGGLLTDATSASPQLVTVTVIDTMDVADMTSEEAHGHRWWHAWERPEHRVDQWPPRFNPLGWQTRAEDPSGEIIWDGGRRMSGGERFTMAAVPGQPLRLVGRSDGETPARLTIHINGDPVGIPTDVPSGEGWVEFQVMVPAEAVTSNRLEVEIRFDWTHWSDQLWGSYHWWTIQAI